MTFYFKLDMNSGNIIDTIEPDNDNNFSLIYCLYVGVYISIEFIIFSCYTFGVDKGLEVLGGKIVNKVIILVFLVVSFNLFSVDFKGKCIDVPEGDKVLIKKGRKKILVRIEGIYCPDQGKAYFVSAREFTKDMVLDKIVTVVSNNKIEDKKIVGKILVDNKDLGNLLVRNGYAWHYTIKSNSELLKKAELYAKNKKLGVWKGNSKPLWYESTSEGLIEKEIKQKSKIYKKCKESNCENKTINKCGYCYLHEKDETMEKLNKKYENRWKKQIKYGLFAKYDKFAKTTWYHGPNNIYSSNNINVYIGKKNKRKPWLVLEIRYSGESWLFVKQFILNIDGKNHYITPRYKEIKRDNGSSWVAEWYQKSYPSIKLLKMIINSKITELRYVGSDTVVDKVITKEEIKSIKTVLKGYYELRKNFNN